MVKLVKAAALALSLVFASAGAAPAATYVKATFSGSITGGAANVKPPFRNNGFAPNDLITGSLVYDVDLVPAASPVPTNVFYSAFPDLDLIPAADAFHLTLDGLDFDLDDNIVALAPAGIQYKNGQFNGFNFITDFAFQSNFYQFRINGPDITVRLLTGVSNSFDPNGFPTGSSLINAKISTTLTNQEPYVPGGPGGVPEPATWAMMILGLGAAGAMLRRRRMALA